MRPIKAIGLAALAALMAMALLGVTTAMAETTQLCKADESPCAEAKVIKHVHEETLTGAKAKLLSSLGNVECNVLFLGDTLGSGAPLVIHGHFTFSECKKSSESCTVSEVSTDSLLEVLKEGHETAKETIQGEVLVKCGFFINCKYNGEGLTGTVKGPLLATSENGEVTINEQTLHKVSGAFCPEKGKLDIATMPLEKVYLASGGGGLSSTSTSLTTSLKGGGKEGTEITVAEGSKVKDTATLSGENASKATGTVKYKVYSDSKCEKLVTNAGEVTVKEGKVPDSEEKELEAAAVYYWQAEYGGDSMNNASTSVCGKEVETVKAKTTLTTKLSGGGKEGEEITVAEGTEVKDQATLSGTKSSTATGTIKYAVYKDKECKELATKAGEGEVKEGKAPASEEKELEAGTAYYWQAEYGGDSLHEASISACGKEVEVVKATMSLSTILIYEGKLGEFVEGEKLTLAEGRAIRDKTTLSGTKSSTAGGTIKYAVYSDSKCEKLVIKAGEGTVKEGKVPDSEEKELEGGAVYYWQASYSGDALHEAATEACGKETGSIIAATSVSTSLSGGGKEGEEITVDEGTPVKDHATLSGANISGASGSVAYRVYSDKKCEKGVALAGEGTVKEGKAGDSEEKILEGGAVYYWRAKYSGGSLHAESTSPCTETATVRAATTLSMSLTGGGSSGTEITVIEGTPVQGQASIGGTNSSSATGTVKYAAYSDPTCETLVTTAGNRWATAGSVPLSEEKILDADARYYWQASYEGDVTHQPSTSSCTAIATIQAAISISTKLAAEGREGEEASVQEGVEVTDTATLTGKYVATATGTVAYSVYSDPQCEELVAEASESPVTAGTTTTSSAVELTIGTYYWLAEYSGDATHAAVTASCGDEVEVVANDTSLTTSLQGEGMSGEEIEVHRGSAVHDVATLHGVGASEATGSVEYAVYSDSECEELVTSAGIGAVGSGSVQASADVTLPVDTYYWQVTYSGDAANRASKSSCGDEVEVVTLPDLTTSLAGEGQSGEEVEVQENVGVTDTASLNTSSAATATGTVTYAVYSDRQCTELVAEGGEMGVIAGNFPPSEAVELPTGIYYWQAEYSGDGGHPGATSRCGDEREVVANDTTLSILLLDGGEPVEELEVEEGIPVDSAATLSGASASVATGTVKYTVYSDSECEEPVADAGEVSVTGGSVSVSSPIVLRAGTYYWQAIYSGDDANKSSTSACGTAVELITAAPLTTSLLGGEKSGEEIVVQLETKVHDTATLTGANASTATGTISYNVYGDPECEELATEAGGGQVEGESVSSSFEMVLPPGTYYWQAEYSGDASHGAALSVCGTEVETVQPPWIVSLGDANISGEGGRWAGNVQSEAHDRSEWLPIDALGEEEYDEEMSPDRIGLCHRLGETAEINIGAGENFSLGRVFDKNLACSGVKVDSYSTGSRYWGTLFFKGEFKPGLDFVNKQFGEEVNEGGWCTETICKGQALQLEEFARARHDNEEPVKMIVVSIGAEEFSLRSILNACAGLYRASLECNSVGAFDAVFESTEEKRQAIERGIENVGRAMGGAGYSKGDYTILVQDYPLVLPESSSDFRYPESGTSRQDVGGCPFGNKDAEWIDSVAVPTVNQTVKEAAENMNAGGEGIYDVKFMEVEDAFSGRRLCEKGVDLVPVGDRWASRWQHWLSWWYYVVRPETAVDEEEWVNQVRKLSPDAPFFQQEELRPNFWGQLALRNCARQAYDDGSPRGGECVIEGPGLVGHGVNSGCCLRSIPHPGHPARAMQVLRRPDEPKMELIP